MASKPVEWLSVGQAAKVLDVGTQRVRYWADNGKLTVQRTSLGRLVSKDSVEALKAERETAV